MKSTYQKLSKFDTESMGKAAYDWALLAAPLVRLPNRDVVRKFKKAVFPTIRDREHRTNWYRKEGVISGMYDDNTTPRWALLWTHGFGMTNHPKGWTIAHVWEAADDIESYTHLGNLALLPECLASLTDKKGPLGPYLRWHAKIRYAWQPISQKKNWPQKAPVGYSEIAKQWNYLEVPKEPEFDPVDFMHSRLHELKNVRVKKLRKLLKTNEK